jgi:hypothetical protein
MVDVDIATRDTQEDADIQDVLWYEDPRALACLGAAVIGGGLLYKFWSRQQTKNIIPHINLTDKKKIYVLAESSQPSVITILERWYTAIIEESFGPSVKVVVVDALDKLNDDASAVFDMRYYSQLFKNDYSMPDPSPNREPDQREKKIREKIGAEAHLFLQPIRGSAGLDRLYQNSVTLDPHTTVLPELRFSASPLGQYCIKNSEEWDVIKRDLQKNFVPGKAKS